jgi:GLPGLI family protein
MRKLLYLILIFSSVAVQAQQSTELDQGKYRCQYRLIHQADSTDPATLSTEEMLLFIGNKVSKFQSLRSYQRDSITNAAVKQGELSYPELMVRLKSVPSTDFKEIIFKNYPSTGQITYIERLGRDNYWYEEPTKLFTWKIMDETKSIAGYNCRKATTQFAGRHYTAWFTSEVPISDGPYKFNGLPGLIMSVNDDRNQYRYELVGLQTYQEPITLEKKNYIKTNKEKYTKVKLEFYNNFFQKLEQSGITLRFDDESQKQQAAEKLKRNNPIELVAN